MYRTELKYLNNNNILYNAIYLPFNSIKIFTQYCEMSRIHLQNKKCEILNNFLVLP